VVVCESGLLGRAYSETPYIHGVQAHDPFPFMFLTLVLEGNMRVLPPGPCCTAL
jgi:hypothetical protein